MMMSIPEVKCDGLQPFLAGGCIPCPRGSILDSRGNCDYCDQDQYFDEDPKNYFKSECVHCPLGTVGGYGVECTPCSAGTIWVEDGTCEDCQADSVCPVQNSKPRKHRSIELEQLLLLL